MGKPGKQWMEMLAGQDYITCCNAIIAISYGGMRAIAIPSSTAAQ